MTPSLAERNASEHEVASFVEEVRLDPSRRGALVDLLDEGSGLYANRGANASARIRGWIIASFEDIGLPDAALPFVLEELESGLEPYLVAAAARAIRGIGRPDPFIADALMGALLNMRGRDDRVTFDSILPSWPATRSTTALLEVLASMRWLGSAAGGIRADLESARDQHASTWSDEVRRSLDQTIDALAADPVGVTHCCGGEHAPPTTDGRDATGAVDLASVVLEDQDGRHLAFADFFAHRPTVVAFFYTRCSNPNKCSLTVTKLGELQQSIEASGLDGAIQIAAISYDPGYDRPTRLRVYGETRGVHFTESVRLFRAIEGHDLVRRFFALRVGYIGSLVNRHGIELFLVDARGDIADTWSRVRWNADDVLSKASALR